MKRFTLPIVVAVLFATIAVVAIAFGQQQPATRVVLGDGPWTYDAYERDNSNSSVCRYKGPVASVESRISSRWKHAYNRTAGTAPYHVPLTDEEPGALLRIDPAQ
jgi:hypothetical protein